jgi:lipoate---protein ligase
MMQVLDTGSNSAEANMRLDEKLLMEMDPSGPCVLHLYQWDSPAATYGYFIDPSKYLDLNKSRMHRIALARRPTGGGIVFHIWDLAFSFLMPSGHPRFSLNTLDNYRFVNESVLEIMKDYLQLRDPLELIPSNTPAGGDSAAYFCMARPTVYDVVYQGRKIAGAAQRRRKNGYLHQGTISLALPQADLLSDVLLSQKEVVQAMMACSFAPLGRYWNAHALRSMREEIQKRLADNLQAKL